MRLKSQIAGIPCLIDVTGVDVQDPDPSCTDSDVDFYGYFCAEWRVLDQRGRAARWLEIKLTAADEARIDDEIRDALKAEETTL